MKLAILFTLIFSSLVFAHEGGHGSLSEGGKFGGITAPVFLAKDMKHGHKDKVRFKAELVRTSSGKLSLYLFDSKMELLSLDDKFSSPVGKLEAKKKGKFTYFGEFTFKKSGTHFEAQLPEVEYKPFNIDVTFKNGGEEFFVGFTNLD